jgi:acylphosphatase
MEGVEMEKVRVRVVVEGRVQGVYFRAHTQDMASLLDLKGWVRNRPDGSVEAVFEGDKDKVELVIEWCRRGPAHAKVTKVYSTWEGYSGEFSDFSIDY